MSGKRRYPLSRGTRQFCRMLKLSEARVMRRAGLPEDFLDHEGKGVEAETFFRVWSAGVAESGREDFALTMGQTMAQTPFVPAIFAFSCSPNTEIGLTRLALFKPLLAPIDLRTERRGETLVLTIASADPDAALPTSFAAFELVYFLDCVRRYTNEPVTPLSVTLDAPETVRGPLDAFCGVTVRQGPAATITLSLEDALRPLVTENAEFWSGMEQDLARRLSDCGEAPGLATRVRAILHDCLPVGETALGDVARRLHLSRRTLQRHLRAEGLSFQQVLEETRADLARGYLAREELSIEEISYLLGYRDPNSFYRAFHGWTGRTPAAMRRRMLAQPA